MEYPETHATTAMLKAMTHPLRRRILAVFPRLEYVRAADLATELGEPANKISFHLRVLADAGLLIEAPERARDRRDRVWTAMKGALNIGDKEHPVADPALGSALVTALLDEHGETVRRFAKWMPEYLSDPAGEPHGTFTQSRIKLSPAQFTEMLKGIQTAIRDAQDAAEKASDPDARVYQLDIIAVDETV